MLLEPALASLVACFDKRRSFYALVIASLFLVYKVVQEHQELMSTMDVLLSSTTMAAGVTFLATQPQNATNASSNLEAAAFPGQAPDPPVASTMASPWSYGFGYDWQRSTEENYRSYPLTQTTTVSGEGFVGDFKEFRKRLDRSYHNDYFPARQELQDIIIRSLLTNEYQQKDEEIEGCDDRSPYPTCMPDEPISSQKEEYDSGSTTSNSPWIVFTAGIYGAGKSHTIQKLQSLGCFPPRSSFVGVDPDEIRRKLPEFSLYRADQAGALTQKEAGMVAELLTDVALSSGRNVVIDGSLRDATWHEGYFKSLRSRFGTSASASNNNNNNKVSEQDTTDGKKNTKNNNNLRIGILYVTAPADEIYQRVEQRGASTGRSVPPEFLERSMREVPEAIERLKPLADFFLHVHNSQNKNEMENNQDSGGGGDEPFSLPTVVVDTVEKEYMRSAAPSERKEHLLTKSEIEATIFQEKCQSIVGY